MPSMPQPVSDDQDASTASEVILGVDTHKDRHVAVVLTPLGVRLSSDNFPVTAAGYRALLAWVGTFGILRRAGVEGTGSYGAALARHLRAAGVEVIRGQRTRQGHPSPAGQDRHPRRRSSCPGSAQRPGYW